MNRKTIVTWFLAGALYLLWLRFALDAHDRLIAFWLTLTAMLGYFLGRAKVLE